MGELKVAFESPGDEDFSEAFLEILDPDCNEYEVKVALSQRGEGPIMLTVEQVKPHSKLLAEMDLKLCSI